MQNYGYGFGEMLQNCQERQRIFKSCLMLLLRLKKIALYCEIMGTVFIIFSELWVPLLRYGGNYGS